VHPPGQHPSLFTQEVIVLCIHVPLAEQTSVVHALLSVVQEVPVKGLCIHVVFAAQASVVHALLSVVQEVPVVRGEYIQPVKALQLSLVQALLSLQVVGV
jgi:hypothetical protein